MANDEKSSPMSPVGGVEEGNTERKQKSLQQLAMDTVDESWRPFIEESEQVLTHVEGLLNKRCGELECSLEETYPLRGEIFAALRYTALDNLKVVILGQDPYHSTGDDGYPTAHGLAFSACANSPVPPSLVNIFKEIASEYPGIENNSPLLTHWARQGVLLINTSLTVSPGKADSHSGVWFTFTAKLLQYITRQVKDIIFVAWGDKAAKTISSAVSGKAAGSMLKSPHPSPLSAYRGFFGCGHFKKINEMLIILGKEEIDWNT